MIFYFSGTGNSKYCTDYLARLLDDDKVFMNSDEIGVAPSGRYGLGFVFPVYSWGVPPVVVDFIDSLPESFWEDIKINRIPVWSVMSCGDEVALAPEMLEKVLKRKGVYLKAVWSVIMPNNYVILPGFDVDQKEVELKKLEEAPGRLQEIAERIKKGSYEIDVVRGSMSWIKTKLVYPLFKRWGIFPKKWHTTDACNGCGKCAASCPVGNLHMSSVKSGDICGQKRPVWGPNCCSCLACYHACPRHAVEYSSLTRNKGQYQKK